MRSKRGPRHLAEYNRQVPLSGLFPENQVSIQLYRHTTHMGQEQLPLFGAPADTEPQGLRYEREFLDEREEGALIKEIQCLPLAEMRYKSYTARRRIVSYGGQYDFETHSLHSAQELPPDFHALRQRVAAWYGAPPEVFTQVLVAEYRPGTPLGWHRDVPDFEDIVGVSLAGHAIMRFRPYPPKSPSVRSLVKLEMEPRSIYLLSGPARWEWQHSVAPTKSLRYSITFRTRRQR